MSDHQELRERIARALHAHQWPAHRGTPPHAYYEQADAVLDALGPELVCFVPHGFGPEGELAVPLNGSCDIEWHRHFYRLTGAAEGDVRSAPSESNSTTGDTP